MNLIQNVTGGGEGDTVKQSGKLLDELLPLHLHSWSHSAPCLGALHHRHDGTEEHVMQLTDQCHLKCGSRKRNRVCHAKFSGVVRLASDILLGPK